MYSKQDINQEDFLSYIQHINIPYQLNEEDNAILTRRITEEECLKVLQTIGKNKSPGPDGLPVEFYITFWDEVTYILIHGYEESYDEEELSEEKKSVMSLPEKYLRTIDH